MKDFAIIDICQLHALVNGQNGFDKEMQVRHKHQLMVQVGVLGSKQLHARCKVAAAL